MTFLNSNICLEKKFVQRVSPEKKNSCASSERKKIRASWKFPSPLPPQITFLMVRPLLYLVCFVRHFRVTTTTTIHLLYNFVISFLSFRNISNCRKLACLAEIIILNIPRCISLAVTFDLSSLGWLDFLWLTEIRSSIKQNLRSRLSSLPRRYSGRAAKQIWKAGASCLSSKAIRSLIFSSMEWQHIHYAETKKHWGPSTTQKRS